MTSVIHSDVVDGLLGLKAADKFGRDDETLGASPDRLKMPWFLPARARVKSWEGLLSFRCRLAWEVPLSRRGSGNSIPPGVPATRLRWLIVDFRERRTSKLLSRRPGVQLIV